MLFRSGRRLLDRAGERAYVEDLIPLATVVTPNLREAGVLTGHELRTVSDQRDAAMALTRSGAAWAVVKGGHATDDAGGEAVDVVCDGRRVVELRAPRVATDNTHGSGCSFASAIAAGLARGEPVLDAITAAKAFVHTAIVGGARWRLGAGHGPLDHHGWNREPRQNESTRNEEQP